MKHLILLFALLGSFSVQAQEEEEDQIYVTNEKLAIDMYRLDRILSRRLGREVYSTISWDWSPLSMLISIGSDLKKYRLNMELDEKESSSCELIIDMYFEQIGIFECSSTATKRINPRGIIYFNEIEARN